MVGKCLGVLVGCCLLVPLVHASNLVINGDFEQPLDPQVWVTTSNCQSYVIQRETHFDPDPDYETYLVKLNGTGWARLGQTVAVDDLNIEFFAHAKVNCYASTPDVWAGGALALMYLNAYGTVLGETRIASQSTSCPWSNGPNMHIIEGTNTWEAYSFNVEEELGNLPGVDSGQIAFLCVCFFGQVYEC